MREEKGLEITDVMIKKVSETDGNLKGYASVNFCNVFVVHNIKILQGDQDLYIAMPRRKTRNGEYKDVAHPITSEFRDILQKSVLEAFRKAP